MYKTIILKSFAVLLSAIIISSCITIERNIVINEDGSGKEASTVTYERAFFDFLVSSAMAFDSVNGKSLVDSIFNENTYAGEIRDKYKKTDGITLKDVKAKFNPDSSLTLKINYSFEKIDKLASAFQTFEDTQGNLGIGKTEILFKKDGKKIHFRYKYSPGEDADSSKSLKNSLSGFFKEQKMIFNITFPYTVKSSNAHKTSGKTLTWEFEMDKMMSDTNLIDMKAELKK